MVENARGEWLSSVYYGNVVVVADIGKEVGRQRGKECVLECVAWWGREERQLGKFHEKKRKHSYVSFTKVPIVPV
jgi:hypothetical protein